MNGQTLELKLQGAEGESGEQLLLNGYRFYVLSDESIWKQTVVMVPQNSVLAPAQDLALRNWTLKNVNMMMMMMEGDCDVVFIP